MDEIQKLAGAAAGGGGRSPVVFDPGQPPIAFYRQSDVGVDADDTVTLTLADGTAYVFENDTGDDGVVAGNIGFVPASTSVANTILALADIINEYAHLTNVIAVPTGTAGELVLIERVVGPATVTLTEGTTNATIVNFADGALPGRNLAVQSRAATAAEATADSMIFVFPFNVDDAIFFEKITTGGQQVPGQVDPADAGTGGAVAGLKITVTNTNGFGIVALADGAAVQGATAVISASDTYTVIAWGD